jgi:hypothetical protein
MAKMCTIRREDDGGDEAPHHQLSTWACPDFVER